MRKTITLQTDFTRQGCNTHQMVGYWSERIPSPIMTNAGRWGVYNKTLKYELTTKETLFWEEGVRNERELSKYLKRYGAVYKEQVKYS